MSSVQSVERAFTVLRSLAMSPAGVTELADRIELPKSTVSRLLSTLESIEIVEQVDAGGPYRLGVALIEIAGAVQPGRNLLATARPHLMGLTADIDETAGISVIEERDLLYLDQVECDNAIQVKDWTGELVPAHTVPSGLVLLAWADDSTVDTFLAEKLERSTPNTITDPDAVRQRLKQTRADGHCWAFEEFEEGINSVAAPVFDFDGQAVAALHVHGPAYRFPPADEVGRAHIAEQVREAAARMSEHLGDTDD